MLTIINKLVPPIVSCTEYFANKISGTIHTNVKYNEPTKVNLFNIFWKYSAVLFPGLIPGTKQLLFFKLSDNSSVLNTIDE